MVWVSNAKTVFNIDVHSQRLTHTEICLWGHQSHQTLKKHIALQTNIP